MKKTLFLLTILLLNIFCFSQAQKNITGQVTDETGQPMNGITNTNKKVGFDSCTAVVSGN